MRSYRNPFRARASEQLSEPIVFLRSFGAGALELLREAQSIWDLLLVLRSASGGGKTSLMRIFTIEILGLIDRNREEFPELVAELESLGALTEEGPTHLGVILNLDRDYRSLLDLGLPEDQQLRLFFRLLDARTIAAVVRAALSAAGADDPAQLELVPLGSRAEVAIEAELLGGLNGGELYRQALRTEREILRPLDALLPGEVDVSEHLVAPQLHSLSLLSKSRFQVGSKELLQRPLVMFDDGHELGGLQREKLTEHLRDRSLQVARWFAERFEALSKEELLIGSSEGRDFELIELESQARRHHRAHLRVLQDISDRRARPYLDDYANVQRSFTDLLDASEDALLGGRAEEILTTLRERVAEIAGGGSRYERWLQEKPGRPTYESLVELRALEIVIASDRERPQVELFDDPLPLDNFEKRQARVRTSARHFLARDFDLPYYAGPRMMAQLGSENFDQYLRLGGDLFAEMLGRITLGDPPFLDAARQDRIAHQASERYWREIPTRVRNGELVRRLAEAIVELAQADTFRPTAPYAPGVTGTAMLMSDRQRLLDPEGRASIRGGEELFAAIASGVASNVFSVQLDYSVKNQRVMVVYLNRLFCPRFRLPLGRGGFRERRLEEMAAWMAGAKPDAGNLEIHDTAQLQL
jgi:hypothetical protein